MIKYKGFTCGCCGKGWLIPFEIRDYQTCGGWWDTWGLCPENKGCRADEDKSERWKRHLRFRFGSMKKEE